MKLDTAVTAGLGAPAPKVYPPNTTAYVGRVMFVNTINAGAIAADQVLVNARVFAQLRDANLRRNFGYQADNPQLVGKVFGVRVTLSRPDSTAGAVVDENTQRLFVENTVLVTGPVGVPKFTQIGSDLGSMFPGAGEATTAAARDIDRVSKLPKLTPIVGGDFVDFTSDTLQLQADQGFTTTTNVRVILEVWGAFVRRGSNDDWRRVDCQPDTAGQLRAAYDTLRGFLQS